MPKTPNWKPSAKDAHGRDASIAARENLEVYEPNHWQGDLVRNADNSSLILAGPHRDGDTAVEPWQEDPRSTLHKKVRGRPSYVSKKRW